MMSCYQKFYTNHIHSSSLLCQLATMWKSQVLCDAIIRTGNIITKAHRVVLVAACPMLQSMENASMGSHLEVRLASDIKQDSVHTFLQYLYEGYMMLTEENCKDVEKIARLLQVDSVIKCISDFYKCLSAKTGCVIDDRYKYSSFDLMEFKHVRSSSIQKTLPETALKRGSELNRPSSPGHKRQRLGRPSSPLMRSSQRADDTLSMAHSYGGSHGSREPWDQGGRLGGRVPPQPGVIDIVEDSIEIIQTDRNEKDPLRSDGRMKQKSVSIAVTSQYNTPTDLQVVSMGDPDGVSSNSTQQTSEMLHNSSSQGSITVSPIPLFSDTSSTSAHTKPPDIQQEMPSVRPNIPPSQPVFPTLTPMHRPPHSSSSKPFAAGSASQSFISSSPQSRKADTLPSSNTNQDHKGENNSNDSNTPSTSADKAPDITIVKVESNTDHNTEGLDMYVDMPDDGIMRLQGMDDSQNDEGSDIEHVEQDQSADWSKEDMSNEGSNLGIDQNNSWYIDQFKGVADNSTRLDSSHVDDIKMQKINAAIGLFRGWLTSENFPTSFENFTLQALNDALEQFSSDFRSKHGQNTYSENTLKDIRECLFTYLQGHSSEWNANLIQHANVQNSFQMTDLMKESYSKSQFQKQKVFIKVPMTTDDVKRLMNSGMFNTETPLGLFRKIWFDLVLHLGIGGQAAMRSLTFDSFLSETDEKGRRYYRLNPDGVDRNQARSCMEMQYWCWDGRMYEVADDPFCPVKSMDAYIEKRNFARDSFFQRPKSSLHYLERSWFESPVGHSVLACLMTRMSEESKLQKTYTNSSVRITLADLLDAQGFDVVDILGSNPRIKMTKTGCGIHRNLSSDQRYQNSQVIHNAYYRFLEKEKK